jgi:hypothetical protein
MKNKMKRKIDINTWIFRLSMGICILGSLTEYFSYILISAIILNLSLSLYEIYSATKKKNDLPDDQTYLEE